MLRSLCAAGGLRDGDAVPLLHGPLQPQVLVDPPLEAVHGAGGRLEDVGQHLVRRPVLVVQYALGTDEHRATFAPVELLLRLPHGRILVHPDGAELVGPDCPLLQGRSWFEVLRIGTHQGGVDHLPHVGAPEGRRALVARLAEGLQGEPLPLVVLLELGVTVCDAKYRYTQCVVDELTGPLVYALQHLEVLVLRAGDRPLQLLQLPVHADEGLN
mmetsp:Transcript_99643/g.281963  ORF Transcript_99643/g.281963 Transcript_99643/m.281963 type:complete len:214 (-) Transcript_99643:585-1226(-)